MEKLTEARAHRLPYKAIKNLKTSDMPHLWDIRDLWPERGDNEIAEELADFFSNVSNEFTPLAKKDIRTSNRQSIPFKMLKPHEVSSHLRHCKKPTSMVKGDIFPQLVMSLHDLLVIPLTKIYNHSLALSDWLAQCKTEIVTVILKGQPIPSRL